MKLNTARMKCLLASCGMTKTQLADKSGVCRASISIIFQRGTCEPKTAGKLAAGLGVSVEEIVGDEQFTWQQ